MGRLPHVSDSKGEICGVLISQVSCPTAAEAVGIVRWFVEGEHLVEKVGGTLPILEAPLLMKC